MTTTTTKTTRPATASACFNHIEAAARWIRSARGRLFKSKMRESDFARFAGGRAYRLGRIAELFEAADRAELELIRIRQEIAALSRELGIFDARDAIKQASTYKEQIEK